jgi:hypothetical protein
MLPMLHSIGDDDSDDSDESDSDSTDSTDEPLKPVSVTEREAMTRARADKRMEFMGKWVDVYIAVLKACRKEQIPSGLAM